MTIFTGAALLACRGHETKVPRPSYISPPDSSCIGVLPTRALRHSCGMSPDVWGVRQIHGSRATCGSKSGNPRLAGLNWFPRHREPNAWSLDTGS